MRRRAVVIAVAWLAGAVLAAVGVTATLNFLVHGIIGRRLPALSPAAVSSQLAVAAAASPSGSRSATPEPGHRSSPPAPTARSFTGGTVWAYCTAGRATLTTRSPAQGFSIDNVSGPGPSASITFKSATTEEVVTVTCSGGRPRFTSTVDNRGGGGEGRHGGGSRGGPGSSGGSGHGG